MSPPLVTKHWRQTWQYEPDALVEFKGRDRWERRKVTAAESRGQWSQTVYQVDESPRYASLGRWNHTASFSSWISGDTWRPLPRREWSARKDYQVLLGTNRHTITATGWVQEENNLKTVLTEDRKIDPARPYVAREYGVARYSRIHGYDLASADEYYQRTRPFWDGVLSTWHQLFVAHAQITLRAPVDQAGLFHKLFDYADQLAAGGKPSASADEVIRESLLDMGAPLEPHASNIALDKSSSERIRSTASIRIASLGIPNTTQLSSSWATVPAPALRISFKPRAPSSPMPVMMIPKALGPAALAAERKRTSTEGQCRFTGGPSRTST